MTADLLILAHDAGYERRFNLSSLAASYVAGEKTVDLVLFFAALAAWVRGEWDDTEPAAVLPPGRAEELGFPPLSTFLASGLASGKLRVYACSASARLLGLDAAVVQPRVQAILGWQTISLMVEQASRVVTF